jgi:hypothetical protein
MKRWFWNVLIAIDQLFNAALGGDPDETISSRVGKRRHECRFCRLLCDVLHWFDTKHCAKSIESDEGARSVLKNINQD